MTTMRGTTLITYNQSHQESHRILLYLLPKVHIVWITSDDYYKRHNSHAGGFKEEIKKRS